MTMLTIMMLLITFFFIGITIIVSNNNRRVKELSNKVDSLEKIIVSEIKNLLINLKK